MKTIAIMQPYFLPYLGYWQLLAAAVEQFVVYDNIEFSKRGWFHRNRLLMNNESRMFSLPLQKDSDYKHVVERQLAANTRQINEKTLRQIQNAYRRAPFFNETFPIIEDCFCFQSNNLFDFIFNSIRQIKAYLGITTELVISSQVEADHQLTGQSKVLDICKALNATSYINPAGGRDLYSKDAFNQAGLELHFIQMDGIEYKQFGADFVPSLSILDVMMFNPTSVIQDYLEAFSLD